MDHRFVAGILCTLSVLLIGVGYVIFYPSLFGICATNYCASEEILYGIGYPLLLSITWLPFFFFALIFVKEKIFWAWAKRVAWIAIPLFLFILQAPPTLRGYLPIGVDRESATRVSIYLFVIVSILFIAWKYWRLSKNKPPQRE